MVAEYILSIFNIRNGLFIVPVRSTELNFGRVKYLGLCSENAERGIKEKNRLYLNHLANPMETSPFNPRI